MVIRFFSRTPRWQWLSNFAESPFVIDGVQWPSVEHYYQAQKYAGTEAEAMIRQAETPQQARKAGRNRSLVVREDWDAVKEDVMRKAVAAKFAAHRRLREWLLATGEEELVHHSTSDRFWGRTEDGQGENRLGEILMELRDYLRGS